MKVEVMRRNRNIEILKEKLKKWTISYFSFSEEEVKNIEDLLRKDIEKDEREIENIREKIKIEKEKLKKKL